MLSEKFIIPLKFMNSMKRGRSKGFTKEQTFRVEDLASEEERRKQKALVPGVRRRGDPELYVVEDGVFIHAFRLVIEGTGDRTGERKSLE
mgnify:CR=1 FL=1